MRANTLVLSKVKCSSSFINKKKVEEYQIARTKRVGVVAAKYPTSRCREVSSRCCCRA